MKLIDRIAAGENMILEEIRIKNFKSLYDVGFQPGKVNVFIGANGSGKSTILEGIGILSAAMTDRVNNNSLQRKGIRLSAAPLYKSKFQLMEKESETVDFEIKWNENKVKYGYSVQLNVPVDDDAWKYHAENICENGSGFWSRGISDLQINNSIGFFMLSERVNGSACRDMGKYIEKYAVFQPDTLTLRGTIADSSQIAPIGLHGGRLADVMQELMENIDDEAMFGSLYMEDVLDLIDWASDFGIAAPKKSNLNPGVPSARQIIEFRDKFLEDNAAFTGYDASEGALYVLFMLSLAMHPDTPEMFAIDSFDHALNPKLAKKVTEIFSQLVIDMGRTVFMTTHNPLVLDGLDLSNDDIRLFTVERSRQGYAQIDRIQISEGLLELGQPLSRLWMNGRLGGVPELL